MSRSAHLVSADIEVPGAEVPPDVREWLVSRGWSDGFVNGNLLWTASGNYMNLTWEQAVAVEMYRFITLGGHHG